jgi:hypothetical protein
MSLARLARTADEEVLIWTPATVGVALDDTTRGASGILPLSKRLRHQRGQEASLFLLMIFFLLTSRLWQFIIESV